MSKRHVVFNYNERKRQTLEIFLKAYPDAIRPEAYAWKIGKLPARAAYSYLNKLHPMGPIMAAGEPRPLPDQSAGARAVGVATETVQTRTLQ